jgi:hypothetical protein
VLWPAEREALSVTAAVPDPRDHDPEWEDRYQRGFTCPTCRGIGRTFHNDLPDGSGRARGCMTCDGTGVAPAPAGRADDRDTAASVAAAVPDHRLRDQLEDALVQSVGSQMPRGKVWRPGPVLDALMPIIATEVEARVQAAAGQRAAEELYAAVREDRTTVAKLGPVERLTCFLVKAEDLFARAAALASPAPAPHAAHSEAGS